MEQKSNTIYIFCSLFNAFPSFYLNISSYCSVATPLFESLAFYNLLYTLFHGYFQVLFNWMLK